MDSLVWQLNRLRGARVQQLLLLALSFAIPLGLVTVARSHVAPQWQHLVAYPSDEAVRQVTVVHAYGGPPAVYVIGESSGILRSNDQGQTWNRLDGGLPHGSLGQVRVREMVVDPHAPRVLYALVDSLAGGRRSLVYWTIDGEHSWRPRPSLSQEWVKQLAFGSEPDELYVITAHEILRSFVFGEPNPDLTDEERFRQEIDQLHWLRIGTLEAEMQVTALVASQQKVMTFPAVAVAGPEPAPQGPVTAWQPEPTDGERRAALVLYIGTRGRGLRVLMGHEGAAYRSVIARRDRDTIYLRQQATIYTICVHPRRAGRIYVGTDSGIYTTEDAGNSWYLTAYPLRTARVLALLIDPRDADTLYAGVEGGGVYVSRDAGAIWQQLGHGLRRTTVFSLAMDSTTHMLYAGTDHGLWRLNMANAEDNVS